MTALVWLRSDLRTVWHSPLTYATENHQHVSVVYFVTPGQWQQYGLAPIKLDLLTRRLLALREELAEQGLTLNLIEVEDFDAIPGALKQLCSQHSITHLYFNAEYELDERKRDHAVKELLVAQNVKVGFFHDTCMVRPDRLFNKQGAPYKVFTPYFHQWLDQLKASLPIPKAWHAPADSPCLTHSLDTDHEALRRWLDKSSQDWPCREQDIVSQIQSFLRQHVDQYAELRDFPAQQGTSGVSPYLSIGAVSPAQLAHQMLVQHGPELLEGQGGAFVWLRELAWRDFYRYVMFHFPHVCRYRCFNQKYDHFHWLNDKQLFDAWCNGQTGYPIVDAAMRCLNATGWMHNRLRMIVASFLCKHLLLPWRWGEDYFMSKLIDGDFASNNGGWQWSASVGTDAAPYFRIFNPAAQGQRYDPEGEFLLQWVPELKAVPRKYLHEPQKWSGARGLDYPLPVVEHKQAVAATKERFSQFLESQTMAE